MSDENGTRYYPDLNEALSNATQGDVHKVLTILKDLNISDKISISSGDFEIRSSGGIKISSNGASILFDITGGKISFHDITLSGGSIGIQVTGGHVTIGDGTTITGFTGGRYYTQGVTYTTASAIGVFGSGTVTMEGGTITGNSANHGGAVTVAAGGTFTMTGGTITGNKSNNSYGAIYIWNGHVTLAGGSIVNNTGGGVRSYSNTGSITIGGESSDALVIKDNSTGNLRLDGMRFNIGGTLAAGSNVYVYTSNVPSQALNVLIGTGGNSLTDGKDVFASYFHSDRASGATGFFDGDNLYLGFPPQNDLYVSVNGSDTTGDGTIGNPYRSIAHAYSQAISTGDDVDKTIILLSDITLTSALTLNSESFASNITITSYNGNPYTIHRGAVSANDLITVTGSKTSVTLADVTIDGDGVAKNSVLVTGGGRLTVEEGTTIQNGGSGIWLVGTSGARSYLHIYGGTIQNHTGFSKMVTSSQSTNVGGVGVTGANTEFVMTGGTITENTGTYAGGIGFVYNEGGSPTIAGGSIVGNTAINSGGGGGIYLWNGVVQLAGGTISGNNGGGVGSYQSTGRIVIGIGGLESKDYYNYIEPLVITGNVQGGSDTNLRLNNGAMFDIRGDLVNGSDIGVWTTTVPTSSADVQVGQRDRYNIDAGATFVDYFHSDRAEAGVVYIDASGNAYTRGDITIADFGHASSYYSMWLSVKAADYNQDRIYVTYTDKVTGQTVTHSFSSLANVVADGTSIDWSKDVTINLTGNITMDDDLAISFPTGAGKVTIDGNGFTINHTGKGSLFEIDNNKDVTIKDVTIDGNDLGRDVGGIVVSGGTLDIGSGATITSYNRTDGNGGAIAVGSGGSLTISNGTLTGNSATGNGGAVYIEEGGRAEVSGGELTGNEAVNGGAIAVGSGGSLTISNGTLTGNSATGNGGAVFIEATEGKETTEVTVSGGSIADNDAGGVGDGIASTDSKVNINKDMSGDDPVGLISEGSMVVMGKNDNGDDFHVTIDVDKNHGYNTEVAQSTGTECTTDNVTLVNDEGLSYHEIYKGSGSNQNANSQYYSGYDVVIIQDELGRIDIEVTYGGDSAPTVKVNGTDVKGIAKEPVSEYPNTNVHEYAGNGQIQIEVNGNAELGAHVSSGKYYVIYEVSSDSGNIQADIGTIYTDKDGNTAVFTGSSVPAADIMVDKNGYADFILSDGSVSHIDIGEQHFESYKEQLISQLEEVLEDFGYTWNESGGSGTAQDGAQSYFSSIGNYSDYDSFEDAIHAIEKAYNDAIKTELEREFGTGNATVSYDGNGDFTVGLSQNITGGIEIPGSLGDVVINLNGHTITGSESAAISIVDVKPEERPGSGTNLIINGNDNTGSAVVGGSGAKGTTESPDGSNGYAGIVVENANSAITVTGSATVSGGKGGDSDSGTGGAGGSGIAGYVETTTDNDGNVTSITGGTPVRVEDGGQVIGGAGGDSGAGSGGAGGAGIQTGGNADVDGGQVIGGNGGNVTSTGSEESTGGNGGQAVSAGGDVTVSNGGTVTGGNGGSGIDGSNSVPGVSGGDGGDAIGGITKGSVTDLPDSVTISSSDSANPTNVTGGNGGAGTGAIDEVGEEQDVPAGTGGDGGNAVESEGPVTIVGDSTEVSGGNGGNGGSSTAIETDETIQDGGAGGNGGDAVVGGNIDVTVDGSTVTGGTGGAGGSTTVTEPGTGTGSGGNGGNGGSAIDVDGGDVDLIGDATVTGGAGGIGGSSNTSTGGTGGTGGIGVDVTTDEGTVSGSVSVSEGSDVSGGAGGDGGSGAEATIDDNTQSTITGNGGEGGTGVKGDVSVDTDGSNGSTVSGGTGGIGGNVDSGKAPSGGAGGTAVDGNLSVGGTDSKVTGGTGGKGGDSASGTGGVGGDGGDVTSGTQTGTITGGIITGGDGGDGGSGEAGTDAEGNPIPGNGGQGGDGGSVILPEGSRPTDATAGNGGDGGTGNGTETTPGNGGQGGDGGDSTNADAGNGGNGGSHTGIGSDGSGGTGGSATGGTGAGGNGGNGSTGGSGGTGSPNGNPGESHPSYNETLEEKIENSFSENGINPDVNVSVEYNPDDGSYVIKLKEDVEGTITIPDTWGKVTIDLNGYEITGPENGYAINIDKDDTTSGPGTSVTIINSRPTVGGSVNGADGTDGHPGGGVAIGGDADKGTITIGPGVIINGGDGDHGSETVKGGAGGTAIDLDIPIHVQGGIVVGGDGGDGAPGGNGGNGIESSANITVTDNGYVAGGDAGYSIGTTDPSSNAGSNGGSGIVSGGGGVTITDSTVQGGTGGDSSTNVGGDGGFGITGSPSIVDVDNSSITGGDAGNGGTTLDGNNDVLHSGGDGGSAIGITDGGTIDIDGSTITGGTGGAGGNGGTATESSGNGGSGVVAPGSDVGVSGSTIVGGDGGKGSNTSTETAGGNGGTGGDAIAEADDVTVDDSTLIGGNGGNGGNASTGAGGNGGNGGDSIGDVGNIVVDDSTITGGNGGNGGSSSTSTGGNGGDGGNAIDNPTPAQGETIDIENSTVAGGNGGNGGSGTVDGTNTNAGGTGGSGGDAIVAPGHEVDIGSSDVTGGNGGNGGEAVDSDPSDEIPSGTGGTGGTGGDAIGEVGSFETEGTDLSGGNGGNGGNSETGTGGTGGNGGSPIEITDGASPTTETGVINGGTISGGNGGSGTTTGGTGGDGGSVTVPDSTGTTDTIVGSISSGDGGDGGSAIGDGESVEGGDGGKGGDINGVGSGDNPTSIDTGNGGNGGEAINTASGSATGGDGGKGGNTDNGTTGNGGNGGYGSTTGGNGGQPGEGSGTIGSTGSNGSQSGTPGSSDKAELQDYFDSILGKDTVSVDVVTDEETGKTTVRIDLDKNITGTLVIPDNLGDVILNMNGHDITANDGDDALVIEHVPGGTGTDLVIKNTGDGSSEDNGKITGGAGYKDDFDDIVDPGAGIVVGPGVIGGSVTIGTNVTVSGGDGYTVTEDSTGDAGNGGNGIESHIPVDVDGGTVTGGNGGSSHDGNGGSGGDAIVAGDDVTIVDGTVTGGAGGTGAEESGDGGDGITSSGGDVTITDSDVSGGAGGGVEGTTGSGDVGNGGNGGSGVTGSPDNVTVEGGSEVSGGAGGNGGTASSGNGGNGGAGGGAIDVTGNVNIRPSEVGTKAPTISGGAGGNGASTSEGNAGNGGSGGDAISAGGTITSDDATISGGAGGQGGSSTDNQSGNGGNGGTGGTGVSGGSGTITDGSISGGNGGAGGTSSTGTGGNGGDGGSSSTGTTAEIDGTDLTGGSAGDGGNGQTGGNGGEGGSVELPAGSEVGAAVSGNGGNGGTGTSGNGGMGGDGGDITGPGKSQSSSAGNGGNGGNSGTGSGGSGGDGGNTGTGTGGNGGSAGSGKDESGNTGTGGSGTNPGVDGDLSDQIEGILNSSEAHGPGAVDVVYDPERGYVITLQKDLDKTLTIPESWGQVVVDMNGHDISPSGENQAGIVIDEVMDASRPITVTIINSGGSEKGNITGGQGAPGISVDEGLKGSITIGEGVTVTGGNGISDGNGDSINGSPGIESGMPVIVDGGKVVGGEGGNSSSGNGGNGGAGIDGSDVTVTNGGEVIGGNGGTGITTGNGGSGNGGAGIIADGSVNVNGGSTVTGGDGGTSDSGTGADGGDGAPAITMPESTTSDVAISITGGSNINGGNGGDGGSSTTGNGGNGGDGSPAITILESATSDVTITIENSHITTGDGGDGGSSSTGTGGTGGNGGDCDLKGDTVTGGSITTGDGGDGGDSSSGNGGNGGDAGDVNISGTGSGTSITTGTGGDGGSSTNDVTSGAGGNGGAGGSVTGGTGSNGGGNGGAGGAGHEGDGTNEVGQGGASGTGTTGSTGSDGAKKPSQADLDKIASDIANEDGERVEVDYDADGGLVIRLESDINGTITIPDSWGDWGEVTIDMNGHNIIAGQGDSAIEFENGSSADVTITNSQNAGGNIIGGSGSGSDGQQGATDGSPAIDATGATGGSITIDSGVTVTGGNGHSSASGTGTDGGAGIESHIPVNVAGGTVIGGNGGNSADGDGGKGGAGVSSTTDVSINDGSTVTGGSGGNSSDVTGEGVNGSAGGSGAPAISGGTTVTVTDSQLTGGDGGNGASSENGNGGNGGSGAPAISGGTTVTVTDSQLTGGDGGNGGDSGYGHTPGTGGIGGDNSDGGVAGSPGIAGTQHGLEGDIEDEINRQLAEMDSDTRVEVTVDPDGSYRIEIGGDINGTINIPDNWGDVIIDLNGHTIRGETGQSAIKFVETDEGNGTGVTIVSEPNDGTSAIGSIVGGVSDGSNSGAIAIDANIGKGSITISGNVTVTGGAGQNGSQGTAGGPGISSNVPVTVTDGGRVTGGNGGNSSGTNAAGGAGGNGITGSGTVTVTDGGRVTGGNGGSGGPSGVGGTGGDGVETSGQVTVEGSTVTGGNGGSGGNGTEVSPNGGTGGAGGNAIAGSPSMVDSDDSTLNGGKGGSGGSAVDITNGATVDLDNTTATGGNGGSGGPSSGTGTGGYGGDGAPAVDAPDSKIDSDNSTITGGNGGSGGPSSGGTGGTGGDGWTPIEEGNIDITGGSLNGGNGGNGGNGQIGGNGGSGGSISGTTSGVDRNPGSGGNGGTSYLDSETDVSGGDAGKDNENSENTGSSGSVGGVSDRDEVGDATIIVGGNSGPIGGATVTITYLDQKIQSGTTNDDGIVTFLDLPYGTYNAVIEYNGITTTVRCNVTTTSTTVQVNLGNTNTSTGPTASVNTIVSGTVSAIPDNLDAAVDREDNIPDNNHKVVDVVLNANEQTSSSIRGDLDIAAENQGYSLSVYVEVGISKTISHYDDSGILLYTPIETDITSVTGYIYFSLEIPSSLRADADNDLDRIVIYREHGGVADSDRFSKVATRTDAGRYSGECYFIEEIGGVEYVTIKAQNFSTYAMGVAEEKIPNENVGGGSGGGGGGSTGPTYTTDVTPDMGDDGKVYITVSTEPGKQYAIRDESGNLVSTWQSASGGRDIVFGPLEPGQTYEVVSKRTESGPVTVEEKVETPHMPDIVITDVGTDSVTVDTEEGVRYQVTDADGNVVPGPDGQPWFTGTGQEATWTGLEPGRDYYVTAVSDVNGMQLTAGPELVRPASDPDVTGSIRHEDAYVTVDDEDGLEYRVTDSEGNVIVGWTSATEGSVTLGPLPAGDVVIEGRDPVTGEVVYEKEIHVPKVPVDVTQGDGSISIATEEGNRYVVVDSDGNPVTGPDGQVWVPGTGGDVTWSGLDPNEDYFVYIQTGEGESAVIFGPQTVQVGASDITLVSGSLESDGVHVTVGDLQHGREYAIVDSEGNLVTGWVSGDAGTAELGPLDLGGDYTVVSRPVGGTDYEPELDFSVPAAPSTEVSGSTGNSVTISTDEGFRYQVVDSHGNPVAGPDGNVWVDGTGGDVTWSGLDPNEDYYIYVESADGVFDMSFGPVHVRPAAPPQFSGEMTDDGFYVHIQADPDREYAIVDSEGNVIIGWTSTDTGELVLGPIPEGTDFNVVSRPVGSTDFGDVETGGTAPGQGDAPGVSGTTDTSVTIDTETGNRYQLVDSEGNIIPGPDGQIWVDGTGGPVTWDGLDPSKEYFVMVEVVDPETGFTTVLGPFGVKAPGQGAAVADDHTCLAWIVLVMLAVFGLFLAFVHRYGSFDTLAWAIMAVVVVVDLVVGFLDLCPRYVAFMAISFFSLAVAWWYFNTGAGSEERRRRD